MRQALLATVAALALMASASPPMETLSGPGQNAVVTPSNWHCC